MGVFNLGSVCCEMVCGNGRLGTKADDGRHFIETMKKWRSPAYHPLFIMANKLLRCTSGQVVLPIPPCGSYDSYEQSFGWCSVLDASRSSSQMADTRANS